MCRRGENIDTVLVPVMTVSEYGCEIRNKYMPIDMCIAGLVRALNAAGHPTTAACCGHGDHPAVIGLADGRVLVIGTPRDGEALGDFALRMVSKS